MKSNTQKLSPVQQFQALRMQIPVLEVSDQATDELVEPFPTRAKQWYKTSQLALIVTAVLSVVGLALIAIAFKENVSLERQLGVGPLRTKAAIDRACTISRQLNDSGMLSYVKTNNLLMRTAGALNECAHWSFKAEEREITFDYAISAAKDPLDILTSMDKAMQDLGYRRRGQDKELEPNRHVVTYGLQ